ncbi:CIC11C00000003669 [Sungouiella intermedia]|uniref:CIC11C00000003669 n=1 Tax=Sungouiella intermedia TaxID=45354 RepID=A0A1L0C4P8_9ASCO|nr:CIC11C00000003669 [[Candida] intermedia]
MSFTFKAVRYRNKNSPLSIKTVSLPIKQNGDNYLIPDDSVLVKVRASALNPVDLLIKNTVYSIFSFSDKGIGFDFSGDVLAVGGSVAAKSDFKIGDKVCGFNLTYFSDGSMAEYILIKPFKESGASIRKIPAKLSYEQAAAYPLVFGTAESLFQYCLLVKTDKPEASFRKVLILGAGTSVGRYAVQLAKQIYGSEHIVVTCSGKTEPVARQYGATEVIDYTKNKNILNAVLESVKITGKFDAILDCCGNSDLFPQIEEIIRSRKEGGAYVTVTGDAKLDYSKGFLSLVSNNFSTFFRIFRSKTGFLPYYYEMVQILNDTKQTWPDKLVEYLENHEFDVVIDSVYELEDFQKGVDRVASNRAVGKVVFTS